MARETVRNKSRLRDEVHGLNELRERFFYPGHNSYRAPEHPGHPSYRAEREENFLTYTERKGRYSQDLSSGSTAGDQWMSAMDQVPAGEPLPFDDDD